MSLQHHWPTSDFNIATITTTTTCTILIAYLLYYLLRRDHEEAVDFAVSTPEQCRPAWRGKQLDPPTIKVAGSTAIQCYAPATGQLLALINPTTPDGIDRALARARDTQVEWSKTTFSQRRRVLKTLLKFLLANQETIARVACLDSGKTRVDAIFGEILVTAERLQWTIQHGEKALGSERRPTNFLMFYKKNEVCYEPLGVVAACVSWNYPFHNLMGPIISGLFSGNSVVVKNSEQTAWSSAYFAGIARSALAACGHDPNVVQALSCWPQTASYFSSHTGIDHLTFIGSRPVAHEVASCAAKALTPLVVELGGKDAAIVLDRPDGKSEGSHEIDRITSTIMRGVFQSAGQNCIGIERVIAMPEAYSALVSRLSKRIGALRVGSDLDDTNSNMQVDVGAMVSSASFDRLEALIDEAVAQGAHLICGGHRLGHPTHQHGHYFAPTLLVDVKASMRIAQEEVFAPICVLMRATSVTDAIALTNNTAYGLGCSVFGPTTSSAARVQLQRVADEVRTGMVAINDFAVFYAVQLPFGGVKGSGYGRFAGEEGLRGLCNAKSVCVDRWPWAIKTSIPGKLDYPMNETAWKMGEGVVELGYGASLKRRAQGVMKMV